MASIETLPSHALDLLTAPGPFATVRLPTPSAVEDPAERLEANLRSALDTLEGAGASGELVGRVRDAATSHEHADGGSVVVVANADDAWSWPLADEAGEVHAELAALPRIGPMLDESRRHLAHVVVLIDREGADIDLVHPGDVPDTITVEGATDVIHHSSQGGWSQRRFQQRVVKTWEENAQEVADKVTQLFGAVEPAAVFVAGDQHAVNFFIQHLPADVGAVVHQLEHGSRADGADLDGMRTDVDHLLADIVARRTTELLERFGTARAHDLGVEGPADTLLALFEGRVETLLVHADVDDDRVAFFGPEASQVAADEETFTALGIECEQGPLLEVALRAAHGTGATVEFVPAHGRSAPSGGIGAILRG
jgi:peptide subunit release factor 1 (eRF1)